MGVLSIHTALRRAVAALCLAIAGALLPAAASGDYADGIYALNHISLEAAVRAWRKAGWRADFLADVKLGDIYANSADSRFYDPVEAYVWFYLAGRDRAGRSFDEAAGDVIRDRRRHAFDKQQEIFLGLSTEERGQARDRIVYILACRGAAGFLELGRLSRVHGRADDGDDDEDGGGRGRRDSPPSVMAANDADALTYFHIADSLGSPLGGPYLSALEHDMRSSWLGQRIIERQAKTFHYWFPPFEFYPTGNAPGGVPLTDECEPNLEHLRALALVPAVPPEAVRHALAFLGWKGASPVRDYQASLSEDVTGLLTAGQLVRAIQLAAYNGDAASQNTLGVMYAKGLGVLTNYARAEYWFAKAADQRYPAALYHLGVLYKVGPLGVDQDLHKANDFMTSSAIAGFRPTMNQLGALLNAAASEPPHPGQN